MSENRSEIIDAPTPSARKSLTPLWQRGEWSYELFDQTRDAHLSRCRDLMDFFKRVWGRPPKQQVLCGFFDSLGPASVHAYEFVDLRIQSPSSPHLYPLAFLRELSSRGFTKVMCMEALGVREDRRKTSAPRPSSTEPKTELGGVSIGEQIPLAGWTIDMGLCFASQNAPKSPLHAVIACTRDSRSIHQLASSLGYINSPFKVEVQGEASSLMYWPVPKLRPREPHYAELTQSGEGLERPTVWPVSTSSFYTNPSRVA